MSEIVPCSVDGCDKAARRGGLCWGHVRRRSRGQRVDEELGAPRRAGSEVRTFIEAVIRLAEAESDEEYDLAWDNLRKVGQTYIGRLLATSRGKAGGKARAAAMTPEERSESGRRAIAARWKKPADT